MIRIILTFLLMIFCAPAWAENLSLSDFETIPVQHEGRLKPLDTFARVTLKSFSGKDELSDLSASQWLAETLFDPISSAERPVFLIRNPTTRHQLGLQERSNALYSYIELTEGLGRTIKDIEALNEIKADALTANDQDLIRIHQNALKYTQILRTLSLILPLNIKIPEQWSQSDSPQKTTTYLDLRRYERDIEETAKAIVARKGSDPSGYSENERDIALLGFQLRLMGDAASNNELLRIIPAPWSKNHEEWHSPWSILQQGQGSPQTGNLLKIWQSLALTWQNQDADGWKVAGQQASDMPLIMSGHSAQKWKLQLEVLSNTIDPQMLSTGSYALALLLILGFLISQKSIFCAASLSALLIGVILHLSDIGIRIVLLERPPVSTLYESLIFVSLICIIIAAIIERKLKNGSGLLIGSISGVFLGLLASSFSADDTLKLLSAVLNTQFWLATHVLCITFGYGWCVITALIAHLNLANRAFKLTSPETIIDLDKMAIHTSMVALLFTAIGTILGGIWADQSWGRFWGWDPKENGALLIVLWLVWLQHGKLSGHLNDIALLAAQAFLSVIVALAWLGVNLLGVGLHSYGFTDGLFWGLGLFMILEILFIGSLWRKISTQNIKVSNVS